MSLDDKRRTDPLRTCRHGRVYNGTACPKCRDEAAEPTPIADAWYHQPGHDGPVRVKFNAFLNDVVKPLERGLAEVERELAEAIRQRDAAERERDEWEIRREAQARQIAVSATRLAGDLPWTRFNGYGEATTKFGGEGVCVAGAEFIWHFGPDREMYAMAVPEVPSLDGPASVPSSEQATPEKFLRWLEACNSPSLRGESRVAMDAQIRVFRQFLDYLRGNEWLVTNVEHANRAPVSAKGPTTKGEQQ